MKRSPNISDILVIGTGAAGLGVALSLPDDVRITVLCKDELQTGASPRAQGGIAAVTEKTDNVDSHIQDTHIAGAGLCDKKTVEFTVKNARSAIDWLIAQGVIFSKTPDNKQLHLTKEGGHSHKRIVHAADKTGDAVVTSLTEQLLAKKNVTCFTQHTAIDLIIENNQCIGATVLDNTTGKIKPFLAKATILATGGASSVYQHNTNPDAITGDGIAMAYRAGCPIVNMEFMQFHPTCLYHPTSAPFLITEAARGEGGLLRLPNGERFMPRYDERAELAPRDIVSRAIDTEMKKHKINHIYLDVTHFSKNKIKQHFPTIVKHCLSLGIDITRQPIPVVPAAHYTCGGVKTNLNGETNLSSFFAVGEVAYTGLHGANRMASNSLLECFVFAASCAKTLVKLLPTITQKHFDKLENYPEKPLENTEQLDNVNHQIKTLMWQNVGIIRNTKGLSQAFAQIKTITQKIENLWHNSLITKPLIETRNLAYCAQLIIESALARKESRGLHFNTDYLNLSKAPKNTVLQVSII